MARKSKYENQSKVICGLEYSSHEYRNKKLRVTVLIDGIKYQHYVCTQTWKNAKDSAQSTFNKLSWRFKKFFKKIIEKTVNYLPAIYVPIQKDFLGNTLKESWKTVMIEGGKTSSVKEVRKWFKKYAKYYHPDFLGRELNLDEKACLDVLVETRDALIEEFREMEKIFGVKLD
jgi:hypothetical protein